MKQDFDADCQMHQSVLIFFLQLWLVSSNHNMAAMVTRTPGTTTRDTILPAKDGPCLDIQSSSEPKQLASGTLNYQLGPSALYLLKVTSQWWYMVVIWWITSNSPELKCGRWHSISGFFQLMFKTIFVHLQKPSSSDFMALSFRVMWWMSLLFTSLLAF